MAEREEYKSAFSGTQIDSSVSRVLSNDVADTVARNNIATLSQTVSNLSAESIGAIPQYSTMPTAGAQWVNHIIQYVGTSTSGYVQGYFYICVQDGQSFSWNNIVVQRDITVDDAMSDSSTNPVQNAVITTALSGLAEDVSNVASQVAGITGEKGAANGIATLDANTKVMPSQASAKIIRITGDTTLSLEHDGAFLYVDSTNNVVITIPASTTVAFPLGAEMEICQWNSGSVTFAGATGVTINSVGGNKQISDRSASVGLKQVETNVWLLNGALI